MQSTHVESGSPPPGNAITRGLNAIFVERRLPYALQLPYDRACSEWGCGSKHQANGLRFRVRRLTSDENFVQNVVCGREYTPADYQIRPQDVVIDIGGVLPSRGALGNSGIVYTFSRAAKTSGY